MLINFNILDCCLLIHSFDKLLSAYYIPECLDLFSVFIVSGLIFCREGIYVKIAYLFSLPNIYTSQKTSKNTIVYGRVVSFLLTDGINLLKIWRLVKILKIHYLSAMRQFLASVMGRLF